MALCRAHGGFNPDSESYAGSGKVPRLVAAFALEPNGSTRPTVIDNLSGTELTATLRSYIDTINSNPDDAPLQVVTGKEIDEAAAPSRSDRTPRRLPGVGQLPSHVDQSR